MREVKIFLGTIERVKDFVNAVTRLDCDMDIVSGRYVIDAKSIMGIFSVAALGTDALGTCCQQRSGELGRTGNCTVSEQNG